MKIKIKRAEIKMKLYNYFLIYLYILYLPLVKANKEQNKNIYSIRKTTDSDLDYSNINNINKNHIILLGQNNYIYVTNTINEEGELFIESSHEDDVKERYVTGLYNNGRNYFEETIIQKYTLSSKLERKTGNSIVINSNNKKYLLSITYDDAFFEFLDLSSLDNPNNSYKENKNYLDYTIVSNINSLFKLRNEDNFIFAFLGGEGLLAYPYYLIFFKGTINMDDNSFSFISSYSKKAFRTSFSYTLSCFETTNYLNCFYLNSNDILAISIFDKSFTNLINSLIEENSDATTSNLFRKGIFLKNEISAYIYFLEDAKRPKLAIKYFYEDNENRYYLNNLLNNIVSIKLDGDEELSNNCDKSDILRVNENRFVFISTINSDNNFLILLFDLYNNDKSLAVRKYLFSSDEFSMNSNLRLFKFRNFIGFSYCYGKKASCSYRILNYGNTTDYEKVDDFLNNLDSINPLNLANNIDIENNLFGYKFIGIKIISIPDKELTGLLLTKNINKSEIIENDILVNDSIIFSYISNKTITEGDYIIEFAAVVGEVDYENYNSQITSISIYGQYKNQELFFYPLNYTGRHGYYNFNLKQKDDLYCHRNCNSCYKNGESDDEQNCITCIDDYYFVENSKNCLKEPIGFYLNENKIYSTCHPLCAFCLSKEINDTYMNCISCKEKDYILYPKNGNCLKCPKYVNYEQTECINEIPQGFYLLNSTTGIIEKCNEYCSKCSIGPELNNMNCDYCIEGYYLRIDNEIKNCFSNRIKDPSNYYTKDNEPNIYYKCYELCGSCYNEGNLTNMNCITCANKDIYEYDPDYKNCFPKISCKYYFYYIYDENNLKSKICLSEGSLCPETKPYEIILTKECVSSCPYENYINSICKLSNINTNNDNVIENFEFEIENNDNLINQILYGNFDDLTVNGNNIVYQITTTENQKNKIDSKINDGISSIQMGECETILKNKYNISENISLIILKYDLKANESISRQVEYEVYDPLTRQKLNLEYCNNTSINLYVPIELDEDLLELYEKANNQGYDLFDPENIFYTDICTPYTSINGTDIILSDRIADILNNIGSLCEKNCGYGEVYTENKKVLCKCSTKIENTLKIREEAFSLKKFENIYSHIKNHLNYKVLKCYKLFYDKKNIIKNFGFYILSLILILFFILMIINFIRSREKLKLMCSKVVEERKSYISKTMNKNDKLLIDMINLDIKNENKKLPLNSKQKKISKYIRTSIVKEPPKKVIKKNQTNNLFFIIKEQPRKKSSFLHNLNDSNNNDNNNRDYKENKDNNESKNNNIIFKNSQKINKKNISKRKSVPSMQFNNSLLMSDNTNSKSFINKRKSLSNRGSNIINTKNLEEKKFFLDDLPSNLSKDDIDSLFYEEELNQLDYKYAIIIDKRDYITYYFSLIKQKQLLIFTFLVNKDYNIYLMKISLFLCSFVLYLMTNTFFFDDDNMHKIYKNNGKYNFINEIPQIIYSTIISSTITIILKNLSLSQKSIIKIKQTNDINLMIANFLSLLKCFKYKLIFFNLCGLILLFFNWYYITLFCSVYTNTQSHLLTDTFTSFGISLLYPFGLSLIPGFLRIPALKSDKKEKNFLYRISQFIAFI